MRDKNVDSGLALKVHLLFEKKVFLYIRTPLYSLNYCNNCWLDSCEIFAQAFPMST